MPTLDQLVAVEAILRMRVFDFPRDVSGEEDSSNDAIVRRQTVGDDLLRPWREIRAASHECQAFFERPSPRDPCADNEPRLAVDRIPLPPILAASPNMVVFLPLGQGSRRPEPECGLVDMPDA
jgi:hypothetical protein